MQRHRPLPDGTGPDRRPQGIDGFEHLPRVLERDRELATVQVHDQRVGAMLRLRRIDPALRIANLKDWLPIQRTEDYIRWSDGLRKAGLPE